ncbi:MAG TPA: HD domain-containing protein [Candidatus Saccharimonadales bacterium]|nr:HD domain-containing protein [Candidatus Saccharimonadales bacterium]
MQDKISTFKQHVREISANPEFVHHKWFVKWHLEIVEKIANELCDLHPEADEDLVEVMAWLHDYGKILSWDRQYDRDLLNVGRDKLIELGFSKDFAHKAADYIEMHDKAQEMDLRQAPIEVQISSSADGCSHLVGPFLPIFWHEATDKTFVNKTLEELMELNRKKVEKDWNHKIVLPEARKAFEARHDFHFEQAGQLPIKFL